LEVPPEEQCLLQVNSALHKRASESVSSDSQDTKPFSVNGDFDGTVNMEIDGSKLATEAILGKKTLSKLLDPVNLPSTESKKQKPRSEPLVNLHHFHTGEPKPGHDAWLLSDTVHLTSAIVILLLLDLLFVSKVKTTSWSFHAGLLGLMLALSAGYLALVFQSRGTEDATAWALCYILEILLSMDNLWILLVIFRTYRIQGDEMRWALTIGLYGAAILRVPLTWFFIDMLMLDDTVFITFGAALVVLGLLALDDAENEDSLHAMCAVRTVKWCFGSHYQEPWLKEDEPKNVLLYTNPETDEWHASTLFVVVCMIPFVDLIFALDSTGSKTGDVTNRYLNLSASLMAIFTLRSMFFIIARMDELIDWLKYGMCAILIFTGVQMMRYHGAQLPMHTTIIIVVAIWIVTLVACQIKVGLSEGLSQEDSPRPSSGESVEDAEEDAEESDDNIFDSTGGGAEVGEDGRPKAKKTKTPEAEDKWAVLDTPKAGRKDQRVSGNSGGCVLQ
jgi:tellurite resistance protein TerC